MKKGNQRMSEVIVSICCITYNHENFIRDALDSFLMQKTKFKYEILIHDDASTDRTPEIIKEYEIKYPDIIKPIYQTENQYSKKKKITLTYQFPRVNGKYIAMCEGDDYWCDENKLQKQFDILENDSSLALCVHDSICKNYKTNTEKNINGYSENKVLDLKQYLIDYSRIEPKTLFQTSSFFFRTKAIEPLLGADIPRFYKECPVGDIPLVLLVGMTGKIFYLKETMSVYRSFVLGSWTASKKNSILKEMKKTYELFNEYSDYMYQKEVNPFMESIAFSMKLQEGKYRQIMQGDYSRFLKKQPWKTRLYIFLKAYFPYILKNH